MEPFNYLRAANTWFAKNPDCLGPGDKKIMLAASSAVKFVLPDYGLLLDDDLKGLSNTQQIRLPFENVVIEFQSPLKENSYTNYTTGNPANPSSKRIVVAQQIIEELISVWVICYVDTHRAWAVVSFSAVIGLENNAIKFGILDDRKNLSQSKKRTSDLDLFDDVKDEVRAVLELIEMLSCRNVAHESLPVRPLSKNQKRNGALPFDEYRVLTVSNHKESEKNWRQGDHRSPREHLRRGHIRRLQMGNVWVNSTIVNPGIGGKIEKQYRVIA